MKRNCMYHFIGITASFSFFLYLHEKEALRKIDETELCAFFSSLLFLSLFFSPCKKKGIEKKRKGSNGDN